MNAKEENCLPCFCTCETLILGCGNWLFGDDGFGPAVVEYLLGQYDVPDDVCAMDVGTGARKLLFTLALSSQRPKQIIIIDAIDKGKTTGEVFELPLEDLPLEKCDDFSLHQVPSSNLARELKGAGVDIHVLVCQAGPIPESVTPGLSDAVRDAVPEMCDKVSKEFFRIPARTQESPSARTP